VAGAVGEGVGATGTFPGEKLCSLDITPPQ
jgi:hypothetical protein